jgi:succinoglycan biosynthesis protein ExoM
MRTMTDLDHHISVCICTFKRPDLLTQLLERLKNQRTDGLFTYSVVVADNDAARSAENAVAHCVADGKLQVTYCVEPHQNIALARNRALAHTEGDFAAFIDDDEFPIDEWLFNLFKTCQESGADGVLGPVKPYFESDPPRWVKDGEFFERPTYQTGHKVDWGQSRTGNVLFRKNILIQGEPPFRAHFDTAGEDVDFFRRMMDKGCSFIWCNEAVAYEFVPASRCTRRYLLRRALLRGSNFSKHPTRRLKNAATSLIAVPCYTVALPVLALFGQHLALKYLIKLCDHSSRLLAFLGWPLVSHRQT